MKQLLIIFFATLFSAFQVNAARSMYVDDFATILGDIAAEDALLSYSQENGIEELLLYELHLVNATYDITNWATSDILADFISKAKENYGIQRIGAIGENAMFFYDVILAYNDSRSNSNERIDIFNLEFEFWIQSATDTGGYYCDTYLMPNGYPCTNNGAYGFVMNELILMNQLAGSSFHPITTEIYVGWPTLQQMPSIANAVDRVLVHAYVSDPNTAYAYTEDRISTFASFADDVSIIFSSEPTFMQNWLENNSMTAAETIYYTDWQNASVSWVNNFDSIGFTYFAYGFNQNVTVGLENITSKLGMSVSPNPVNNILTIESEDQIKDVRIFDALGKLTVETKEKEIDVSRMKLGIYFIHVTTNQGTRVMKIFKN